ncbi:hypothetical protein LO762_30360 [Actinocorallia sp. API 0066]|uniref:hypothetical protein n=1 Tax=Actinocorallia sp. API 0066 TaxID=2896846 RepID=UPI001E2A7700|nr:hypothetical protein [Actinocorallia sp. API 0066]MCD0453454.1 hypothetical protein [Actinocorallia sp. API 0066]
MDDRARWDGELAGARAEREAREAAFRQGGAMPEGQRLALSRQTYPRLREAAGWAVGRYREAGVPGQGRPGARRWPVGQVEVPIGPNSYGGYPETRVAFLWADEKGNLFASADDHGSARMTPLSPDDVGDFLGKDGDSLGVARFVHDVVTAYEEWKAETGGRRFKVKVTFHPVRLVVFLVLFCVLAYLLF